MASNIILTNEQPKKNSFFFDGSNALTTAQSANSKTHNR